MHAAGAEVALRGDDARKLLVVLRARTGDEIDVCDSSGRAFRATLLVEGERARATNARPSGPGGRDATKLVS